MQSPNEGAERRSCDPSVRSDPTNPFGVVTGSCRGSSRPGTLGRNPKGQSGIKSLMSNQLTRRQKLNVLRTGLAKHQPHARPFPCLLWRGPGWQTSRLRLFVAPGEEVRWISLFEVRKESPPQSGDMDRDRGCFSLLVGAWSSSWGLRAQPFLAAGHCPLQSGLRRGPQASGYGRNSSLGLGTI